MCFVFVCVSVCAFNMCVCGSVQQQQTGRLSLRSARQSASSLLLVFGSSEVVARARCAPRLLRLPTRAPLHALKWRSPRERVGGDVIASGDVTRCCSPLEGREEKEKTNPGVLLSGKQRPLASTHLFLSPTHSHVCACMKSKSIIISPGSSSSSSRAGSYLMWSNG